MCQVLFDIIKDGDVSIDHVQNDIMCNFDSTPKPSPQPPGPPQPPKKTFLEETFDFVKRNRFVITILLLLLLLVVSRF
jgi:hypothetical protein